MSNTAFKKTILKFPIQVSKGGTGVGFLTEKGILIGNNTVGVITLNPGVSDKIVISDGTNWVSGTAQIGDGTVTYSKLDGDLVDLVSLGNDNVDWSLASIFSKTLTGNTTLTFSNYQLDKNIILIIDGDYSLALPNSVLIIGGTYDGTKTNYLSLHCTNSTSGNEEVWVTINQAPF